MRSAQYTAAGVERRRYSGDGAAAAGGLSRERVLRAHCARAGFGAANNKGRDWGLRGRSCLQLGEQRWRHPKVSVALSRGGDEKL